MAAEEEGCRAGFCSFCQGTGESVPKEEGLRGRANGEDAADEEEEGCRGHGGREEDLAAAASLMRQIGFGAIAIQA